MSAPQSRVAKLEGSVNRLSVEVGRLRDVVEKLVNMMGRVVFPEEAMNELTGELRVLRHLLDKRGEFRHVDRNRAYRKRGLPRPEQPIPGA